MKVRICLIVLLILAFSPVSHVDAKSIKTRLELDGPVLYQKALAHPDALKRDLLDDGGIKPMRVRSIEQIAKINAIDVFQITYESWENGNWEMTDRYTLSSSLLPAANDLSDYEGLLLIMIYLLMSSGTEGDIGESFGLLAPLLTIHEIIFEVITMFQYACHEEFVDGEWAPDYRLTSQLNGSGEPVVIHMDVHEEGNWIALMHVTLAYTPALISGGRNQIAAATMQVTSLEDYGTLKNIFQFELNYVAAGLKQLLLRLWTEPLGEWLNGARLTYTYDQQLAENAIIELSVTNGLTWFEIYRIFYTYDAQNRLTESLTESVDLSELSLTMTDPTTPLPFENDSRETMAYDAHGNLIELIDYFWVVDYWVSDERETYAYDANNHLTRVETFYGDYDYWEPDDRTDFSYSGDLLTQELSYTWTGYDFEEEDLTTYAYDAQNRISVILYQEDDGSGMANETRKMYTYEGITAVENAELKVTPTHFTISNYPNPFNAGTIIRFTLPESLPASVDIFNASGQQIIRLFDGIARAGENTLPWQGLNEEGLPVPSGIYLIRLNAGQETYTERCLLMK